MTSHAKTVTEVQQWLRKQLKSLSVKSQKAVEQRHEVCMVDINKHLIRCDNELNQQSHFLYEEGKRTEFMRRTVVKTKEELAMINTLALENAEKIDTTWMVVQSLSEQLKNLQTIVLDIKHKDVMSASFLKQC